MKIRHLTPILALAALAFSGCALNSDAEGNKQVNLLGAVKYEQASFEHTKPTTVAVSTKEIVPRKGYTGDKLTLLWGLVTLKDY
ncbi:MAG: hypothetical protein GWO81_06610 [Verrucomicrobia bacterium]|nr:hypothetical protein [Verrucomicrobiota bacterium]